MRRYENLSFKCGRCVQEMDRSFPSENGYKMVFIGKDEHSVFLWKVEIYRADVAGNGEGDATFCIPGQLPGQSTGDWSFVPRQLDALPFGANPITSMALGREHTLVYCNQSGRVWAFGRNDFGQTGYVSQEYSHIPFELTIGGLQWRSSCAGDLHTVLMSTTGEIYSVGSNRCVRLVSRSPFALNIMSCFRLVTLVLACALDLDCVLCTKDQQTFFVSTFGEIYTISAKIRCMPLVFSSVLLMFHCWGQSVCLIVFLFCIFPVLPIAGSSQHV